MGVVLVGDDIQSERKKERKMNYLMTQWKIEQNTLKMQGRRTIFTWVSYRKV